MFSNTQALQYRRLCTTPKHVARLNVTFNETQRLYLTGNLTLLTINKYKRTQVM